MSKFYRTAICPYKSDGLAAVVHIKEYGVALILGDVHAIGQTRYP